MVRARTARCEKCAPSPVAATSPRAKIWTLPTLYTQVNPVKVNMLSPDSGLDMEEVAKKYMKIANLRRHWILVVVSPPAFQRHI